jgi:dTDP-4-dehydrorhamnose 3,5-epimerase
MIVTKTAIPDVLLITPAVHRDGRGFFVETWAEARYLSHGIGPRFVQDNQSRSQKGTLRGMHAQLMQPQGKLVRALRGEIYDVAVDGRPNSPTFGKWVGALLSEENFQQLWVPPGMFHGFCVTSEIAEVEYKCSAPYARGDEIALRWDDPALGIDWPTKEPLLSAKDSALPSLAELRERLAAAGW